MMSRVYLGEETIIVEGPNCSLQVMTAVTMPPDHFVAPELSQWLVIVKIA